jgi:dTDP-glucose pyrophosphorylase
MSFSEKIKQRLINREDTLIHALKIMDVTGFRSLLVVDKSNLFTGILSIGDIQRAIIKNLSLEMDVASILRPNPRVGDENTPIATIREQMLKFRMEFLPVVNKEGIIRTVYFWEDLFLETKVPPVKKFDLPVVIMAGGFGIRLKPLTNVLPKPLVPFGDKTMLENIFDRFAVHGCNTFFLSLNYKADLIQYYIENQRLPYSITYLRETEPLGTAGSLNLVKDKIQGTFFVSNCDILIEQDYSEILGYHQENSNDITIVAALKHYPIPYGVMETAENGLLTSLQEKPELTFKINSGMYILESSVLTEIPEDTFFHITQLIEKIHARGGKVGVFPVSEKSWKDIGDWVNYFSKA